MWLARQGSLGSRITTVWHAMERVYIIRIVVQNADGYYLFCESKSDAVIAFQRLHLKVLRMGTLF